MLEINEANPGPRVFNIDGATLSSSYEGTVNSLIAQIVPHRANDVKEYFDSRKQKKKVEKPQAYIRRFTELKNQADFDEICLKQTACAIGILPAIAGVSQTHSYICYRMKLKKRPRGRESRCSSMSASLPRKIALHSTSPGSMPPAIAKSLIISTWIPR